ncbi:hypothetical protein CFC21_106204 [Triticum aestivum]|uniref:Cysteine proteinase n=2 Tax=Triticum aestivum TaxID=4565 RepID=A0A3B6SR38_WHEAT|nr:ervatamin-B-like [Triticum aestivum]KAF7105391.1 hypothetical protein CFC21_106204 [Triticum aestivum]
MALFSTSRCSWLGLCVLLVMSCLMLAGCSSESLLTSDDEHLGNHHDLMMDRFHLWMTVQNRSYSTADVKARRYEVYRSNMRFIEAVNAQAATSGLTYELGEGPFTDLSSEEFMALYTGQIPEGDHGQDGEEDQQIITTHAGPMGPAGTYSVYANFSAGAPRSIDWRNRGAVTPVKNQGQCGSCWAFSTVATIEGLHKIKRGTIVSLSEQQLVDCDSLDGGCNGGQTSRAFLWIKRNGGITTTASYRYKASRGQCMRNRKPAATIIGSRAVKSNSEVSLMNAVANRPVAVAISVDGKHFHHFKLGIYNGPCGDGKLNHAVTVVGYGQQKQNGAKYWIVKNSWGGTWGDKGFMQMKRGTKNPSGQCGIAMQPVFPLMKGGRTTD